MNRIAIVGRDDRIYVSDTDASGETLQPVTPQGQRCTWPTWAPSGDALAYSVYPAAGSNGQGAFRIMAHTEDAAPKPIYVNEPNTDAIAQNTPHYMMWSPDSSKLAFVTQRQSVGLSLTVCNADGSGTPQRLIDGGPLYFCWAQDSQHILAHSRELHYLFDLDDPVPAQVPVASLGYMAPSASRTDDSVAVCGEISDNRQGILIANILSGGAEIVAEIEGSTGFSWSPNAHRLAVASGLDRTTGYYSKLTEFNIRTSEEHLLLDEPLLCFFWSPDGSKIAYVTPSQGAQGSVRWGTLHMECRSKHYLPTDFVPSKEQLTMFMFFDQYNQSHALWSPDGEHLLFAGMLGHRSVRTELPNSHMCSVYMADVRQGYSAALVAEGSLGVWSA